MVTILPMGYFNFKEKMLQIFLECNGRPFGSIKMLILSYGSIWWTQFLEIAFLNHSYFKKCTHWLPIVSNVFNGQQLTMDLSKMVSFVYNGVIPLPLYNVHRLV